MRTPPRLVAGVACLVLPGAARASIVRFGVASSARNLMAIVARMKNEKNLNLANEESVVFSFSRQ